YPLLIDPWLEQQKLSPEDAGDAAHIGFDVAVDGDTALVGAFTADPPRVYVYVRGAEDWELQATLMPDGPNEDAFGRSVSLSGDTALISETLWGVDAGEQGSAYIFTRSGGTWTQQARLSVEDAEYEGFGSTVA